MIPAGREPIRRRSQPDLAGRIELQGNEPIEQLDGGPPVFSDCSVSLKISGDYYMIHLQSRAIEIRLMDSADVSSIKNDQSEI